MPPIQLIGPKDPEAGKYFTNMDPEPLYEDLLEIGHGSFGAVYYARHKETKEVVAIKKMSYGGKKSQEKWKDIVQEVQILSQLQHRNIIQYQRCYLTEHTVWLLMEYCLGSASDILEVHKSSLREEEISVICKDTLLALEYLHKLNFIHRDVKAGNILLTESGLVKLADFGSASISSPANSFIGTPYWMAPEVILAMDDGEYTGVSDIWSLGITSIELAELKPPLFSMHAMAALYHIPQNEAPTLRDSHWSPLFKGFIESCLQKDVNNRPNASLALKHAFIEQYAPKSMDIINELINRTKAVVREMDKRHAKRIKKFLMEEINEDDHSLAESNGSLQNHDDVSLVDESSQEDECSTGGGSNTNSLCDIHEGTTLNTEGRVSSSSDSNSSAKVNQPALPPRRHIYHNGDMNNGHKQQPHSSYSNQHTGNHVALAANRVRRYNSRGDENAQNSSAKNFATIRTPSIVKKQKVEHAQDDLFREQMTSYRKMRKQHQKELKQLESKQDMELEAVKSRLSREYDTLMTGLQSELLKIQRQHQQNKEKNKVSIQAEEDHLKKHLQKQKKGDLEKYKKDLSKQRKQLEEDKKKELSSTPKKDKDDQMKTYKKNMEQQNDQALIEKEQQLTKHIDIQVRKHKRQQLIGFHQLEQRLLKEELNKKETQIKESSKALRKNDEEVQDLENKHLGVIHKRREEQHRIQHTEELRHQREYSERQEKELQKRHLLQTKRLPRSINENKAKLKKQLKEAIETQTVQFKARLDEELSKAPRTEHKTIKQRLKAEQEYKKRVLFENYEQLENDLVTSQNITLDEAKTEETHELKRKLQQQTEELVNYQSKIRIQTNGLHSREKKELQDRVSVRRAELEQKIEDELQRFNTERATLQRELHERQAKEIEAFDKETASLNIDPSEIYIADDEFQRILQEEECSLSGFYAIARKHPAY